MRNVSDSTKDSSLASVAYRMAESIERNYKEMELSSFRGLRGWARPEMKGVAMALQKLGYGELGRMIWESWNRQNRHVSVER